MNYIDKLQNVAVLGAAGKMGSGILLLTAVEMTNRSLLPENKEKNFVLHAVDVSPTALKGLIRYVRQQAIKIAEKSIVMLRTAYADNPSLIENSDVINQYVNDVVSMVQTTTRLESAYDAYLIFEAVNEREDLKIKLFKQIDQNSSVRPWFFTNTSSVPIGVLNEKANLEGRILGFHFYNPPAVQKLVELIVPQSTLPELDEFAVEFSKALRKVVVRSHDIAGFIGNGHFMRDALFGIQEMERLTADIGFVKAVFAINRITQDFLVRPMGIFQLIDYVGIDVVRFILQVMNPHFQEDLHHPLLDKLFEQNVLGGQHADGSQKDGFFKYENGAIQAVFDLESNEYVSLTEVADEVDAYLGALPSGYLPWKKMVKHPDKANHFAQYFATLQQMNSKGSDLALRYGQRSKSIAEKLVATKVALDAKDVNTVLMTGFFHAYGPINNFFKTDLS